MEAIGRKRWTIAEGYIPGWSHGPEPQMVSQAICILNASDQEAHVIINIFYADCNPVGPYQITVEACRTKHIRFNDLTDPEPIPRDTDYSSVSESNVPIVVEHMRLDSRQADNALLSTIAYSEEQVCRGSYKPDSHTPRRLTSVITTITRRANSTP